MNELEEWFEVIMDAKFPQHQEKAIPTLIMMVMKLSKTKKKYAEVLEDFGKYLIKKYGGNKQ